MTVIVWQKKSTFKKEILVGTFLDFYHQSINYGFFPVINWREKIVQAFEFLPYTLPCLVKSSHDSVFRVDEARLVKFVLQVFVNSAVFRVLLTVKEAVW